MAATGTPTTNLGLRIMNGTDPVDVADINANSQTLDDKIGAVPSNTSVQAQITSANEAISILQTMLRAGIAQTLTNVDANDYRSEGTRYFTTGCSNVPASYFLCLSFTHGTDFVVQIGIPASYPNYLYYRSYASSAWNDWKLVTRETIACSTVVSIPASGSSVTKSISGLTSDHQLIRWNFSSSAENNPPVNLTWTTANGSFTITNNGGTTSETIKPMFILPVSKTAT